MRLFKNLKARILKSIVTWSEMGKQTAQAKEVYCMLTDIDKKYSNPFSQKIPVIQEIITLCNMYELTDI